MTQEGTVDEFWTTGQDPPGEDNVRPLLQALAAARRKRVRDVARRQDPESAIVVDLRPSDATELPQDHPAVPMDEPRSQAAARIAADAAEVAAEAAELATAAEAAAQALEEPTPPARRTDYGRWIQVEPEPSVSTAPHWGDLWRDSVQGWVRQADGTKIWRPIVTTTTTVPNWDIDTGLGMVTGESACAVESEGLGAMVESRDGNAAMRRILERDRAVATDAMVSEAVARGAHAVIGVKLDYTFLGECLIVTATGTAVTLRTPS